MIYFTEVLAKAVQGVWSSWMTWQFSLCVENEDGSLTIPAEHVSRWRRQIREKYEDLPRKETGSDRNIARGYLYLLMAHLGYESIDGNWLDADSE